MAAGGNPRGTKGRDTWLERQNRSLRDRGHHVTLDLHKGWIRLRATLPPKAPVNDGDPWKQHRISTGLRYPDQASEAVKLAEKLGTAIEVTQRTKEPFDWSQWERTPQGRGRDPVGGKSAISGREAVNRTEKYWSQQRKRSASASTTWEVDYAKPLRPLLQIANLRAENLVHLVECTELGSRTRRRTSQAAAMVAQALEMSAETVQKIRKLGAGYSPITNTAPRSVPADLDLEKFIDDLPRDWQWAVGICAVYGARPHEALLYAEVLANNTLAISGGKTGRRQSIGLPVRWIERWELKTKRLPQIDLQRSNKEVGSLMVRPFLRAGVDFRPYDLRHAWAVRAIYTPKINPSLAAKSLGHSLQIHNTIYQKWFDASGLEALQAELVNLAA